MPEINTAIQKLNELAFSSLTSEEENKFFETIARVNENLSEFPYEGLGFTIKEKK